MANAKLNFADLTVSRDDLEIARCVFGMSLYAPMPFSDTSAEILHLFDRFTQIAGKGTLNHYSSDTMTKHKPVNSRALGMLPTWLKPGAPARDTIGIEYIAAEPVNAAPSWRITFSARERLKGVVHPFARIVHMDFPVEYAVQHLQELQALFREAVETGVFRSGHAGYAYATSRYWEKEATEQAWAKSMRHPGVDIKSTSVEFYTVGNDAIMAINWLTFIDTGFVEQLGGLKKLQSAAKEGDVKAESLKSGFLLQTGDVPEIGDVNRGDDLPKYKHVYRMLRPLMDPALSRLRYFTLERDAGQRTRDWVERHGR